VSEQDRAVSPVISTILMVAIVVILAATITVFVLDVGEEVQDPGPNVARSSGEFVEQDGFDGGIVRITHVAGDAVPVEELEVAVDATDACGERARIINLPGPEPPRSSTSPTYLPFDDDNFERGSNSIISQGNSRQNWSAGVLHRETSNTFAAGSFFEFRIKGGDCQLNQGEEVLVRVIHVPSNSIIVTEELTA
jgi:flagellin-like protein